MKMKQTIMSIRRYLFLRGTGSRSKTKKKNRSKRSKTKKKNKKEEEVYQEPSYGYNGIWHIKCEVGDL